MSIDEQVVLLCAMRYALGRRTYVTSCVSNEIINNWCDFPKGKQVLIKREISEAIADNNIGSKCDLNSWKRILKLEGSA